MALIRTFIDAPVAEIGHISVSDGMADDGEQFIGIKMLAAGNLEQVQAIYVLDRNEARALVLMLQMLLKKGGRNVH